MEQTEFDVVIIGAGACGLMAAYELVLAGRKVAIVEARDRIGGRVNTVSDNRFQLPVELGAEFVHGDLKETLNLLKKASVEKKKTGGSFWHRNNGRLEEQSDLIEDYSALENKFRQLEEDLPVANFIENHLQEEQFQELRFTLRSYVEGYYAADPTRSSTYALKEDLTKSSDAQYRIQGGYGRMLNFLFDEIIKRGGLVFLSTPVNLVNWKKEQVEVKSDERNFTAAKLIVTVPVGVLQTEAIRFQPALGHKMEAARELGFGPVVKTVLAFNFAFWKDKKYTEGKDLDDLGFMFSRQVIPTWWTYYPEDAAMITGWSGGPHALKIKDLTDEEILHTALQSLSGIFNISLTELRQQLKGWLVGNWVNDRFCLGGYSYDVVNGAARKKLLLEPEEQTIYFSGEGLVSGPEIGTVNAALVMGKETARKLIAGQ